MTVISIARAPFRHAAIVISELALVKFIEGWNRGDGSFIANFEYLEWALAYDRPLMERYDQAVFAAEAVFGAHFGAVLRQHLQPVIQQTFRDGLRTMCTQWAVSIAGAAPAEFGAPRFSTDFEWVTWCLTHLEDPAIVDPDGGDLFPAEQEKYLLSSSLHHHRALALRTGWQFPLRRDVASIIR